jgi:hypothetical protein
MLRADMHQVFEEANENQYLVFITGSSRTAGIELTSIRSLRTCTSPDYSANKY